MYYITRDRKIQCRRLQSSDNNHWSDPKPLTGELLTHPFSNVTSNYFPGQSVVDIFFIDSDGFLHVARCAAVASGKDWPGAAAHQALGTPQGSGTQSVILPGTAIAAVAPSSQHELVFAVGRDLHLYMATFTARAGSSGGGGGDWKPPVPIGTPGLQLFAHTRLAAYSPRPSTVQVAAISQQGDPVIFALQLVNASWVSTGPWTNCDPRPELGWDVNPFSDLALGVLDGATAVILCAGTRPGRTALLVRKLNSPDKWRVLAGGEQQQPP